MGRIVSIHEYDLKPGVNLWGAPEHPRPSRSTRFREGLEGLEGLGGRPSRPFLRDHQDRIRVTAYEGLPN